MMRKAVLGLFIALFLTCVSHVRADIVTLKDGTVYEGIVTKENGAQVVIEIVVSNIKTTKTFPRYKVKSIEYQPLEISQPENDAESQPALAEESDELDESVNEADERPRSSARERLEARKNRVLFMEVPVRGTIGMETNATGLRNALTQASRKNVTHVVFTIDSPGGYLYDAIESLKILKEFDEAFEYHAMVDEGAISAASIFVAAADQIWVRPGSRVGGAVAYSNNNSSGAAEVDAKLNSIWAADVASRAQTKGHPPEVFRAMVEPAAELWIDADGNAYPSRPGSGGQQLDNATSVLTIRADQMVQMGMAKEFAGELDGLGEQLDLTGDWHEVRALGIRAMEKSFEQRESLDERYQEAAKVFLDAVEDFERDHPENHNDYLYYVTRNRGRVIEGPSFQRWRERADKAIRHCDIMIEALTRMANVNKAATKIGAIHLAYVPDEYGDDVYKEVQDARAHLVSIKNNPPQP